MRSSKPTQDASKHAKPIYLGYFMRSVMDEISNLEEYQIARVKRYIEKHRHQPEYLNAHYSKTRSRTILTWAVSEGYAEIVLLLLSCKGIEVNNIYHGTDTPLTLAVNSVSALSGEMLKALLDYPGIDVNVRATRNNETALCLAVAHNKTYHAKLIFEHGGHSHGSLQQAFQYAASNGNLALLNLILQSNGIDVHADVDIELNEEKKSLLVYSVEKNRREIVKAILGYAGCTGQQNHPNIISALQLAAKNRSLDIVRIFIAKNLNGGVDLFSWAATEGHEEIIDDLLSQPGFDGNNTLIGGHNYLSWCIAHQYYAIAEKLLNHRVIIDVNARTQDGNTALKLAAKSEHQANLPVFNILISRPNIEINVQNIAGNTALITAAHSGSILELQALLKFADININLCNNNGTTPLIAACRSGYRECVDSLLAHPELAVNAIDNNLQSALIGTVIKKNPGIVKALLCINGININLQDIAGKNALMYAAELGLIDVVAMLLDHDNSSVNAQDNNGDTALILAARSHDDAIIIKALLAHGANIAIENKASYTALMAAKKAGHKGVCPLLKVMPVTAPALFIDYQQAPEFAPNPADPATAPPAPSAPALEGPESGNYSPRLFLSPAADGDNQKVVARLTPNLKG